MTIQRRTFLRGAGAALALPFLESVSFGASRSAQRLAFVFVPNGIHMPDWRPDAQGDAPLLEPLARFRKDILPISNLAHLNARALGDGPGDHARSAACFLTGAHPVKTAGRDIRAGVSVDQVAARHLGRQTAFRSLELGCEPARQSGNCDSGYSCAYSSNIAWRTPHSPMGKEVDPRALFHRLVGRDMDPARRKARQSILDYVREDARSLRTRLSASDRRKLDEYFTGVRELERRIDFLELSEAADLPWMWSDIEDETFQAPAGIPRDFRAHMRVMMDLMVLAFQLDLTRVASFMVANEGSNRNYEFIGAAGGHHHLSHHGGEKRKIDRIRKINRFHMEQFAYLLGELERLDLMDSTAVVYGSAISDGNRHNHDDLPVLVAGRGGGIVKTGGHLVAPKNTPMCNLYVSLLQGVGVPVRSFGDSTGPLAGFG
ncbi:MAG: DUF1552 domain-containing protein [Planctomycetota bacterium]